MNNQMLQTPVTMEDWQRTRTEVGQRGLLYQLFVDGWNYPNPEEGELFGAETPEEAKSSAHWRAWRKSCQMDKLDTISGPKYPTHGYRLYFRGVIIIDFRPPTPEEVANGKVRLIEQ